MVEYNFFRPVQYRRGRAAAESIIPVEIDLALSLERLLPLKNRIAAVSTLVPVTNGAMADITVQLKEERSKDEINTLFKQASINDYKGILDYTGDPLVSADIKGNTNSCIMDGTLTSVAGRQVKLIAWFDNEYGYTSRMIDWLQYEKVKQSANEVVKQHASAINVLIKSKYSYRAQCLAGRPVAPYI